jgi:glycerophosphoryl diester phosphodiesterase
MTANIGHRGAAGLEPENTLRSFRRAAAEGADAVELDLRLTRDGRLVVMHDATVDRTMGGTGEVARMALEELREADAGLGERIPTFEEVVEAVGLPIYAEIKAVEVARPLAALVERLSLEGRIVPISFLPEALSEVRRALPGLPLGLILPGAPPDAAELARALDAQLVSAEAGSLRVETVEGYRRADLRITAWTVNEPEEMERLLKLGLDGIVTDRPDLLAGAISRCA